MANVDKISLLKELEFYSRLLKKHETLKKEKELKSIAIIQQQRINQQADKPKSFHSYKVEKNHCISVPHFSQNYSFRKPLHSGIADKKKGNELYNQRQNFNSKYSFTKNKAPPVSKFVVNSNVSDVKPKAVFNSKNKSITVPSTSSNKLEKLPFDAKDFIKEVESLTKLIKKTTASTPHKISNSDLKCNSIVHNKQPSQRSVFYSTSLMKKESTFSKKKDLVAVQSKGLANREKYFLNSNSRNNLLQEKNFNISKSVYKKDNANQLIKVNNPASVVKLKNTDELKASIQSPITKSISRKVIFSDSKKLNHSLCASGKASILQIKPSFSATQRIIMKLHTPNKIVSSSRKVFKKSPHVKIKSPTLHKIKFSNAIKDVKPKQTKYRKVNLSPPNKRARLEHLAQHKSSLKKIKKNVNSKYKVINKTSTLSSDKKAVNTLSTPVDKKNTSLNTDCDTFLEALNDSAIDKLEKNLLAITSELTAPFLSEKNEVSEKSTDDSVVDKLEENLLALSSELTDPLFSETNEVPKKKVIQPVTMKTSSKINNKRILYKKSKSKISKYKVINLNAVQKSRTKIPLRRDRAVLVRRLFKSKNVIINKNATPTNYSAKLIKSKYLSLYKRKSPSYQKPMYATVSQHLRFKGARSDLRQMRYKTNTIAMHHSRFSRKANYGYQTRSRQLKSKIKNRLAHSPVVFIQGTRYARNLNGKTLRKLPNKGYTKRNILRANTKLIMKTPENSVKSFSASTNLASRALHRSINRILTASSKKLSKVNTYCMFYNRFGRCNRGVKCTYIHDPSKIAVCTRFLRGTCKIDGCPFSHVVDPGKMAVCSYFLVGQCDKENCLYRHEKLSPNAVLCKDFVQGYCSYGKECKKAHILICPKYMQGECDKGSSCAFPHPPQKAKKNVKKEAEPEREKPTEVLLDTVLRYFQQGGDSKKELDKSNIANLFVPKRKQLEQQPSFIPL